MKDNLYNTFKKHPILLLILIMALASGTAGFYIVIWDETVGLCNHALAILDSVLRTISLFFFETPDAKYNNIFVYFSRLLAYFFMLYSVITLLMSKVKYDLRLHKHKKSKYYTLVCGLGDNNRHYLNTEKEESNIIIVELNKDSNYIDEYRDKGFSVIHDDCLNAGFFNDFKIENLKYLIISIGDDRKNIEVANNFIKKYSYPSGSFTHEEKQSKKIFIHIEDKKLKLLFQKEVIKSKDKLELIPYSYFEQSAKLLFTHHSILGDMHNLINTEEPLNMIVVGDGKLALEVVYQICLLAHLPNENIVNIYCISEKAKDFVEKIYEEFRYIKEIPRIFIEAIELNNNKPEFCDSKIFKIQNLTNVFIAYEESDINLDIALDLHDKVFLKETVEHKLKTKIFFGSYHQMILSKTISEDCGAFSQFYTFGNASEVLSKINVINEKFDNIAKLIHKGYGEEYKPDFLAEESKWEEIENKWHDLSNIYDKESNKAQAMHMDIKLAALGFKKEKSEINKETLLAENKEIFNAKLQYTKEKENILFNMSLELLKYYANKDFEVKYFPKDFKSLFEKLIRSEHNRWNAYHYLNGWEYNKKKNKQIKQHDCLIPLSNFDDPTIKITLLYDIYSIVYIPNYLANTGYKIVEDNTPYKIIGVTGHRNLLKLENNKFVSLEKQFEDEDLRALHNAIKYELEKLKDHGIKYTVISPLADGADRIVASKAIDILNANIEVPIPDTEVKYKNSFIDDASKEEFDDILDNKNITIKKIENFKDYGEVGRYVVDKCDILFAIWDGEKAKGKGGTAEIIQYAKGKSKKIIYFSPDGKKVSCSKQKI